MKKHSLTFLLAFILFSSFAIVTLHAQTTVCNPSTTTNCPPASPGHISLENPFKSVGTGNLLDLLYAIVHNIVLPIGGIIAVLAFIYVGFKFVTARGNSGELTKARTALLYTVIGTALLLGAEVITTIIQGTINSLK